MSEQPGYRNILVERRGAVGIVTLNRPAALNALNAALISERWTLTGLEALRPWQAALEQFLHALRSAGD